MVKSAALDVTGVNKGEVAIGKLRCGGGSGGGGGGRESGGGAAAMETAPDVESKDGSILLDDSLYLYFNISDLTALNSDCRNCTCCCNAEIAPMHPYTGSLSLTFASYTRLFAASALCPSGTS